MLFHRSKGAASALALASVVAVALTACSSSGSGGGGGGTTSAGGSSASSPGGSASTGGKATGTPIKVVTVGPFTSTSTINYGEQQATAKAAVSYINDNGGINGHPIDLTTCDDMFTPTLSVQCYVKAIADKSVVADVGGYNLNAASIQSTVEAAHFPIIGDLPSSAQSFTSSDWYPFSSGNPNQYYGAGVQVVAKGAKRVGFLTVSTPSIDQLIDAGTQGAASEGGTVAGKVKVDLSTVSMGPAVAKLLADKPDGIIFALTNPQTFSAIPLLRQQGYKGPIMVQSSLSDEKAAIKLANGDSNVFGFQSLPPVNQTSVPGIKTYQDAIAKYAPGTVLDELGLTTWMAFIGFQQVASQISGDVTRTSIVDQLNKTTHIDFGGIIPSAVTWWGAGAAPNPAYPRLRDAYSTWTTLSGSFGWDGQFHGDAGAPTKTAPAS